jgi:hypothetical protein
MPLTEKIRAWAELDRLAMKAEIEIREAMEAAMAGQAALPSQEDQQRAEELRAASDALLKKILAEVPPPKQN